MDGWGKYFPLIWPRIVLEPYIPSLVCNLDNEAVIYYGYLPEAENINVKTCQLMDYTFDGNETIIPYETLPKSNNVTQDPGTSGF